MPAQGVDFTSQSAQFVGAEVGMRNPDVVLVGGGVIGVGIAWRCAQRGMSVTVVDPAPGTGSSHTAAGMLAPVTELHYEGRAQLDLNLESARRYPDFVAELEAETGQRVGYRATGTVQAAWDAADLAALRDLAAFHQRVGVRSELLTSRDLRAAEPALAPGLPGGLLAPEDHQVDNRALFSALLAAARRRGVSFVAERVTALDVSRDDVSQDRVTGVTIATGDQIVADTTVLAAGAWSATLTEGVPVRPVKGQTLRLAVEPGLLQHVVRGSVRGKFVYLVPRDNGELVVGASSEEAGFDLRARAGVVYELLRDAQALVPELSEAEFIEVSTSLRPGSPDDAPLLGHSTVEGLILATGHYRNGILLAPVTADEIARVIAGEESPVIAAFSPSRLPNKELANKELANKEMSS
jgi:glycine oxidase